MFMFFFVLCSVYTYLQTGDYTVAIRRLVIEVCRPMRIIRAIGLDLHIVDIYIDMPIQIAGTVILY